MDPEKQSPKTIPLHQITQSIFVLSPYNTLKIIRNSTGHPIIILEDGHNSFYMNYTELEKLLDCITLWASNRYHMPDSIGSYEQLLTEEELPRRISVLLSRPRDGECRMPVAQLRAHLFDQKSKASTISRHKFIFYTEAMMANLIYIAPEIRAKMELLHQFNAMLTDAFAHITSQFYTVKASIETTREDGKTLVDKGVGLQTPWRYFDSQEFVKAWYGMGCEKSYKFHIKPSEIITYIKNKCNDALLDYIGLALLFERLSV